MRWILALNSNNGTMATTRSSCETSLLETVLITYVIVILRSRDRTHAVDWTVILFVILKIAGEDGGHSGRNLNVASPNSGHILKNLQSWSSAYSEDLTWRIVWQREAMNLSVREVAGNLCIDPSTVFRITTLFRTTGNVAKKPYLSFSKADWTSAVLCHILDIGQTRDLPQGITAGITNPARALHLSRCTVKILA